MLRVFMVSSGCKTSRIPPLFGGGIESYEFNLSKRLAKHGQEAHMICRWFPGMPLQEELDGVHLHRIKVNDRSERLSLITFSLRGEEQVVHRLDQRNSHDRLRVVRCARGTRIETFDLTRTPMRGGSD